MTSKIEYTPYIVLEKGDKLKNFLNEVFQMTS